jgi:hypothetical protein
MHAEQLSVVAIEEADGRVERGNVARAHLEDHRVELESDSLGAWEVLQD